MPLSSIQNSSKNAKDIGTSGAFQTENQSVTDIGGTNKTTYRDFLQIEENMANATLSNAGSKSPEMSPADRRGPTEIVMISKKLSQNPSKEELDPIINKNINKINENTFKISGRQIKMNN